MYPYNHKKGQRIQTDAPGVAADRAFLAHYHVPAADAVGESNTAVMALAELAAAANTVLTGFTNPAVARNVKVVGTAANMAGDVQVYGTNMAGEAFSETIALDGTSAAPGSCAFKTITKVVLPAQTNTPAKQKASVEVTAGASAAGDSVLTFTAVALGDASPKDVTVTLEAGDSTFAAVAAKIAAALNADEDISVFFAATVDGDNVIIESKTFAAQDGNLNMIVKTAGDPSITVGAINAAVTAGKATDKVSVGIGKKFGVPYLLKTGRIVIQKLFGDSADAGTVTSDDDLEKNVFNVSGTPDAQNAIDLYIIV